MLSTSHNRAYQDFITLLTNFRNSVIDAERPSNLSQIEPEFEILKQWFEENIVSLDPKGIEPAVAPRWQSIQREILREFKLLTTDTLFLFSARQNSTKTKRLKSIGDRTTKLIGYCQGLLQHE